MNNAMSVSIGETTFLFNYGKHPLTLNTEGFSSLLAQVNTTREGYEHFVTDSSSGSDSNRTEVNRALPKDLS